MDAGAERIQVAKNGLKNLVGVNYYKYVDDKLAGDFAYDLTKAIDVEIEQAYQRGKSTQRDMIALKLGL